MSASIYTHNHDWINPCMVNKVTSIAQICVTLQAHKPVTSIHVAHGSAVRSPQSTVHGSTLSYECRLQSTDMLLLLHNPGQISPLAVRDRLRSEISQIRDK